MIIDTRIRSMVYREREGHAPTKCAYMPLPAFLFKELLIRAIAYTVGVHEPNLLGLTSGTNTIYAETGTNPCDNVKETFGNLCRYIAACKQMFFNTGFETLHLSSGKRITLYIKHN